MRAMDAIRISLLVLSSCGCFHLLMRAVEILFTGLGICVKYHSVYELLMNLKELVFY